MFNIFNILKQKKKIELISITQLAKKYHYQKKEIENYLIENNLIVKKGKWIIPTPKGKEEGIVEKYNAISKIKYILLPQDFKIGEVKETIPKDSKRKLTAKEKLEKGIAYEEYIANYFKEQGWTVWEHGKEKGVKDSSIDLFIKKGQNIYFVQCKNWKNWKINHKEIKATRMDTREYLKKNKELWNLIKKYNMKILYVTPKKCLTKGAYTYIQENKDIVEYQVIPITS